MPTIRQTILRTTLAAACLAGVLALPGAAAAATHPAKTSGCSTRTTTGWTAHRQYRDVAAFHASTSSKDSGALLDRTTVIATLQQIATATFTEVPTNVPVRFEIVGTAGGSINGDAFHKKLAARRADFVKTMLKQATDPVRKKYVSVTTRGEVSETRTTSINVYTCGSAAKVVACKTENPSAVIAGSLLDFEFEAATKDLPRSAGLQPLYQNAWGESVAGKAVAIADETKVRWGRSVTVRITGYASPEGSDSSNNWLAKERAQLLEKSLKKALKAYKLKSGQVNFVVRGSTERLGAFARLEILHCGG